MIYPDPEKLLNRICELIARCRHRNIEVWEKGAATFLGSFYFTLDPHLIKLMC